MSANLDIELLRTFHAILRFGRFLAAASHLNRSPSAVSTHVRRLEELAGGRLFERDN
ncbi:TPA: LysR family transcriptional regulator, partial [Pseudomonas aeruginosa]